MARIRSIKPEFFTSRRIARLPVTARLTFIGLWTHVDDEGRAPDEPRLIKAALWPLDDKHTVAKVEGDLRFLADEGRIVRYQVDGERFLAVIGWGHQRIDKAKDSEYPAPPNPGSIHDSSTNDHGGGDEESGASRAPADRIGSGSDRIGSEAGAKAPPKRATGAPDAFPLDDDLRAWAGTNVPTICDEARLQRETERFLDHHRAKGSTMKDWRAAWRTWMGRAVDYAPRSVPSTNGRPLTTVERSLRNIQEGYDDDRRRDQPGAGRDGHVLAPARAIEAGT